MSWEAGPGALTLPGKHTRLTATVEASGGGVCTESLPPEGSGAGKDLETPRWGLAWLSLHRAGAGGCSVPRCWPPGFLSHAGIQEPQAKEISGWVGEEGLGTCWRSCPGKEALVVSASPGGLCTPRAPPGLSIKPPHSPQPVIPAGPAECLSPWTAQQRVQGNAGLKKSRSDTTARPAWIFLLFWNSDPEEDVSVSHCLIPVRGEPA